ncbi:MAG: hypothetical protein ABUK01_02600 [Leptospirales bacterium]
MNDVLFVEVQQFRQAWLWVIILAVVTSTVVGMYFVARRRKHHKKPVPRWSLSVMVAASAVSVLVAVLVFVLELRTTVKTDGLYLQFYPLHTEAQKIDINHLSSAHSITYSPLKDFGGWGIRSGAKGKAYNVSGNQGVMITFSDPDRQPLLIGSNQVEALERAIVQLLEQQAQPRQGE